MISRSSASRSSDDSMFGNPGGPGFATRARYTTASRVSCLLNYGFCLLSFGSWSRDLWIMFDTDWSSTHLKTAKTCRQPPTIGHGIGSRAAAKITAASLGWSLGIGGGFIFGQDALQVFGNRLGWSRFWWWLFFVIMEGGARRP